MSSITTEATLSLQQNGRDPKCAIRLSPSQPQTARLATASPGPSQQSAEWPARRRPKKPAIPRHPIPAMQEAFAESLAEVTSENLAMKPRIRVDTPQIRRDRLLDQEKTEGAPAALWRFRPGQNCHELRKLVAQISFGVYLLLKGMANSNAQVVAILQGHIDEVDDFLKTAMEDLQLATQDLNTRLDFLKLPLGNLPAFAEMLEDRDFRLRIVEGNVRIEHILSRTSTALAQTIQDVEQGMRAAKEFTEYLASEEYASWRVERPEVSDIYDAMRGNTEGWLIAFADLEEKRNTLDLLISRLADMVTEMDRCAGEVSRRTRYSIQPFSLPELAVRPSHESQTSFVSSQQTTPPQSPGLHVPPVAPRISLRLSTMGDIATFLDLDPRSSLFGGDIRTPTFQQYTPPAESSKEIGLKHAAGRASALAVDFPQLASAKDANSPAQQADAAPAVMGGGTRHGGGDINPPSTQHTDASPSDEPTPNDLDDSAGDLVLNHFLSGDNLDSEAAEVVETAKHTEIVEAAETEYASRSSGAAAPTDSTERPQDDTQEDASSYILQPRTYTQPSAPSSPLPSSYTPEDELRTSVLSSRLRNEPTSPMSVSPVEERSSIRVARFSKAQNGPPAKLVLMGGSRTPSRESAATARRVGTMSSSASASSGTSMGHTSGGEMPQKKRSIRERVSMRTAPPESIQVPSANAPQLQRPVFASPQTYQNYRTFTGPDSARSNDTTRVVSSSVTFNEAETRSSSRGNGLDHAGFAQPSYPHMIPSPQSDHQYFRPVLASPHSPLQQRPHTAGLPSRPHHLRNQPSSMGMSMLSSVTTMTQDSKGQPVLKKKRSAFGWLKKAFTLDDDERATFDQRRQATGQNAYYDNRSPKFLDGKRIR